MLPRCFGADALGGDVAALKSTLSVQKSAAVFAATQNARYHLTAVTGRRFLYVVADRTAVAGAAELLGEYTGEPVVALPPVDETLINQQGVPASVQGRIAALAALRTGKARGAVIAAEGLTQYFPKPEAFSGGLVRASVGIELEPADLDAALTAGGYRREEVVESPGEFARRGDIADVWCMGEELPYRIEWFGDTIESIRVFAPDSMVSLRSVAEILITPKTDTFVSQTTADSALKRLNAIRRGAKQRLTEILDETIGRLSANPSDGGLRWLTPFVTDDLCPITAYFGEDDLIVLDEPRAIDEKLRLHVNAHRMRVKHFIEAGEATEAHFKSILDREEVAADLRNCRLLGFQQMTSSNPLFEPQALFQIKGLALPKYSLRQEALIEDLKGFRLNRAKVYIYAGSERAAKGIEAFLLEHDIAPRLTDDPDADGDILVLPQRISRGFNYPFARLVLIGTDDVVRKGEAPVKSERRKRQAFVMPEKGDYVVHETHGIGLYEGVETVETRSGKKDFCVVLYKDGDKLYLPVDKMDRLEKYTGGGTPPLYRLGGKQFERVKERVKQSIKGMAFDLLSLYDKRLHAKGHRYQPDTQWQKEMEEAFPYRETDDQLIAVHEIKKDMESGKVMDRVLCGDVGFGKTEVAIRAMFKTVMDGKQAAFLSPTTILSEQHYNTVRTRLAEFGVTIDVLNRFADPKKIREALERIRTGKTDIVIGTHRVLSSDVVFHDLGLLVLDEEQRFGVEHKEKIKTIKNNVNVLSLSATPIPRTLHMAMTGIRDISTLETPPQNRLPVETYVLEYSDALLKDAVSREVARGGQVFILFNRVQGIEGFYRRVTELLGDGVKVVYAHGQMKPEELEDRIQMFYDKQADVLIATTIIENGIDIPDANTLFVVDADRLGLSELYQLRGRVGRSYQLAYAYFTVREGKVLTENATKRLTALQSNTELGSGFKIAMQDLEIRGAGNVLGREQHGNMEKVGYELYCRLLNECVGELRGVAPEIKRDVEIVADGDMSVPDTYIADQSMRVRFYKQAAILADRGEVRRLIEELKDAFGKPPMAVLRLITVAYLKNLAAILDVKKVMATQEGLGLQFYDNKLFRNEKVFAALDRFRTTAVLSPGDPPMIIFRNKGLTADERLKTLREFLEAAVFG